MLTVVIDRTVPISTVRTHLHHPRAVMSSHNNRDSADASIAAATVSNRV